MAKPFCLLVLSFCVTTLYSCGTYDCVEAYGLRIGAVSLTAAELDTIILRKFVKGSSFTQQIDSVLVIDPYQLENDTATAGAFSGSDVLKSKYDYEIYVPAINRLTKITDMFEPQLQGKNKSIFNNTDVICGNTIQSYKKDGILLNATQFNYQFVYITK